ncbi:MAG: rhomboid family intramembrane serine protease [Verrucomicrobiales bacterium]
MRDLLRSPVTWSLVVAIVGIQLWVGHSGGPEGVRRVYEVFGLSREGCRSGNLWQLATYGMLHGNGWHVGMNALFVLLVGSRIERMLGGRGLLWACVWGVLGGGVAHLALGGGLLVGFSGACFALVLLVAAISPQSRMLGLPLSGRSLGLGVLVAEGVLAMIDPAAGLPGLGAIGGLLEGLGLSAIFDMGHACHLGGGVAGLAFGGWILRPRVTLAQLRADRERRERH